MKESLIQIQTTVLTEEEAKNIAQIMIMEKLSACIQYYPIQSVYTWKGQVEEAQEYLVIIKATKNKFEKIQKKLEEIHSYELPQITSIRNDDYLPEYGKWIERDSE
jgi:periplasmic divalent cation tolerance protein